MTRKQFTLTNERAARALMDLWRLWRLEDISLNDGLTGLLEREIAKRQSAVDAARKLSNEIKEDAR